MSKSHWLTRKWRKRILKRLYYASVELNHTRDCDISTAMKDSSFSDAFTETFIDSNGFTVCRMKTSGAPRCTCGVDTASSLIMRAIITLRDGFDPKAETRTGIGTVVSVREDSHLVIDEGINR